MNESFWVVERFENDRSAGYWDGGSSRSFQPDINKAIQFRRKEDAFWATRGWHWTDTRITEHMMMNSGGASCRTCQDIANKYGGFGPSHDGSKNCESGSIASGGKNSHCSCDTCF